MLLRNVLWIFQVLLLKEWVIVDIEVVLGDIFSIIFAPHGFYTNDLSECKQGRLPVSRIKALFDGAYDHHMVVTILTELRLGVHIEDGKFVQIPALLRDIETKASVIEDNRLYAQSAGIRFTLTSETDIFSCSSFPKVQVTMLHDCAGKVQLWTHGLCCIIDAVHVIVYMASTKRYIDVIVRSETVNPKGCFEVRRKLEDIVEAELHESSAGSTYCKELIRPADLVYSDSSRFTTYKMDEVYDYHSHNKVSITCDGQHADSVQELLFCNYIAIEGRYFLDTQVSLEHV